VFSELAPERVSVALEGILGFVNDLVGRKTPIS
jgi:hypothetical protein